MIRQTQADSTDLPVRLHAGRPGEDHPDRRHRSAGLRPAPDLQRGGIPPDRHAGGRAARAADATYERQAATHLLTAQIDALGRRTEYTYDAKGNVTSVIRLAGTRECRHDQRHLRPDLQPGDQRHRPAATTPRRFGYSPSGALTSVTDPLNHTTTITPHATGQPAAIQTPLNHTTQLTYDAGDLVATTDPLGRTTTRFLDGAGRVFRSRTPSVAARATSTIASTVSRRSSTRRAARRRSPTTRMATC